MPASLVFLLSLSILIPVFIGLVRFKKLGHFYYPMFVLLVIGLLTELLSYYLIRGLGLKNGLSQKIYSLIECSLILYQLYVWRGLKKNYSTYIIIFSICLLTSFIENVFILTIDAHGPYFRMVSGFFIVLLSINQINAIMVRPEALVLKNPIIVFCVAFIVFFSYQIIFVTARYFSNQTNNYGIYAIYNSVNVFTNILFAIALFLVKGKDKHEYERHLIHK